MPTYIQQQFSGGEIAPLAFARSDIDKFSSSLAESLNMILHTHGAISNRSGLQYLAHASTDTGVVRLIPFQYNTEDTYQLEFTATKIRPIRNGGFVLEDDVVPSGIDVGANTVTTGTHGYANGDYLVCVIDGVTWFLFAEDAVSDPLKIKLMDHDSVTFDITASMTFESIRRIYTVTSPYADGDLLELNYKQTADQMTITHRDHEPQELTRTAHTAWTITPVSMVPSNSAPASASAVATSYNDTWYYRANNLDGAYNEITSISSANPAILRITSYDSVGSPDDLIGIQNGQLICLSGLVSSTGDPSVSTDWETLNGKNYVLQNRTSGGIGSGIYDFNLTYIGGANVNTGSMVGTITTLPQIGLRRLQYKVTAVSKSTGEESLPVTTAVIASDDLAQERPATVRFASVSDTLHYNVYREQNEIFGYIGSTTELYFNDHNYSPLLSNNPPDDPIRNPIRSELTTIITNANPSIITAPEHGLKAGDRFHAQDVESTGAGTSYATLMNGNTFYVHAVVDADTFSWKSAPETTVGIDTSIGYDNHTVNTGYIADHPALVAYHEQRRAFASQYNQRQTIHWSAVGLTSTFTEQEDAFSFTILDSGVDEIRHILSGDDVILFTAGSIIKSGSGENSYSIQNIKNVSQTNDGISDVAPLKMRSSFLYIQANHSRVFDLAYTFESDKYDGQELTILVPHMIDNGVTITSWVFQKSPEPIVWAVMSDGTMKSMTYDKQNNIFGWGGHVTDGTLKYVSEVPENSESVVTCVVARTIGGTVRQYIERFADRTFETVKDCKFLDSMLTLDNPLPITNITETSRAVMVTYTADVNDEVTEDGVIEIMDVLGATELNNLRFRAGGVVNSGDATSDTLYLINNYTDGPWDIGGLVDALGTVLLTHSGDAGLVDGDAILLSGTGISAFDRWMVVEVLSPTTVRLEEFNGVDMVWTGTWGGSGTFLKSTVVATADVSTYASGGVLRQCKGSLSGLQHLAGKTVTALADGDVHTDITVTAGGSITLPDSAVAGRIHIGLPYAQRFKTLPPESPDGQLIDKDMSIQEVSAKVYRTRGFEAGPELNNLSAYDVRSDEDWNEVSDILTAEVGVSVDSYSDKLGQVYVNQPYPLPITVQAIGFNFEIGD